VLDQIDAVRETVMGWFDVDRSGWTAGERSSAVRAMLELRERAEAAVLAATADWNAAMCRPHHTLVHKGVGRGKQCVRRHRVVTCSVNQPALSRPRPGLRLVDVSGTQ
jgi:hypothetical protein